MKASMMRPVLLLVLGAVLFVPLPGSAGIIVGPLPCPPQQEWACETADGAVDGAERGINSSGARAVDLVNRSGSPVRLAPHDGGWDGLTAVVPGVTFAPDTDPAGIRIGPLPCPPAPSPSSACKPLSVASATAGMAAEEINDAGAKASTSAGVYDWWAYATRQIPDVKAPNACDVACDGSGQLILGRDDKTSFTIGPLPCPPSPRSVCQIAEDTAGLIAATLDAFMNDSAARGTWAWLVDHTPHVGGTLADPASALAYAPCVGCGVDNADALAPKAPGCAVEAGGSCAPAGPGTCGVRCGYDAARAAVGSIGCGPSCACPRAPCTLAEPVVCARAAENC